MAAPKVFISSTCYDLREIRDSLSSFVRNYGFDPVLSEHGDVFFHPDLHTHESCVYEVGNCQLFILIIGGRFGGQYVADKDKSVTNAEYEAAVKSGIPIFTYIKGSVLENHHMYQMNKDNPHVQEFEFPAIEKKVDTPSIFNFINRVRGASINNAYEGFQVARDIENHLRKQWASMFFDFLKNRDTNSQINQTTEVVEDLKNTGDRLEALVKEVYKVVDSENSVTNIKLIEQISKASEFFDESIRGFLPGYLEITSTEELDAIAKTRPSDMEWPEYMVAIGVVEKAAIKEDDKTHYWVPDALKHKETFSNFEDYAHGFVVGASGYVPHQKNLDYLYKDGLCKLSDDQRRDVLEKYTLNFTEHL